MNARMQLFERAKVAIAKNLETQNTAEPQVTVMPEAVQGEQASAHPALSGSTASLVSYVMAAIGQWKRDQGLDSLPDDVAFQQAMVALNALNASRAVLAGEVRHQ